MLECGRMVKPFKSVSDEDRKDSPILVRMNKKDLDTIKYSASIRNLSVSEFMRRAALGRKADVSYETKIVLQLSEVVRAIRAIHKAMVEHKIVPPEHIWGPLMDSAEAAMLRISK